MVEEQFFWDIQPRKKTLSITTMVVPTLPKPRAFEPSGPPSDQAIKRMATAYPLGCTKKRGASARCQRVAGGKEASWNFYADGLAFLWMSGLATIGWRTSGKLRRKTFSNPGFWLVCSSFNTCQQVKSSFLWSPQLAPNVELANGLHHVLWFAMYATYV